MSAEKQGILKLRKLIEKNTKIVAFTGAGISTESGIPDFRSPGGVWEKYQPINFQDFIFSEAMRRESWRRKIATDEVISKAEPNPGHLALAKLCDAGKLSALITQNIDGLHQLSGVPEDKIIELHGNTTYASCLDCGKRFELEDIRRDFLKDETIPFCGQCGGMVKTATISFGQNMPEEAMRRATKESVDCDLFLAIGSSLVVYPAAGFPELAKQNGAELAIINRDPTAFDSIADLTLRSDIGPTLSEAVTYDK